MRRFALVGLLGLALSGWAQESAAPLLDLNGATKSATPTLSKVIGEATSDLLPGNGTRGGYMTRYAPVIPYSESVYVDGKRLQRDVDYWFDYASGSLAFAQPVGRLSTIQVYYRYDPQGKRESVVGALPILSLSFGQGGSLSALYMPGVTETTKEGVAYRLSAYGMQNAMRFGGGSSLQGYFFIGSREAVNAYAAPNGRTAPRASIAPSETAQFIVQQLQMNAGALQIQANYQDIGKGFSAQKMLGMQNGLDANQIAAWEREKGIKRYDYAIGLKLGGASLQQSQLRIQDEKGDIQQEGWKFTNDWLNLNWTRREAAAEFQRFKDLGDPQKGDWQRERGLVREQLGSSLQFAPNSALKWDQLLLKQGAARLERDVYTLETPWLKASRMQQRVGEGFTRFGDLAEADKGQLAREVGMSRDHTHVEITQPNLKLAASEQEARSTTGRLEREQIRIETEHVVVEHTHRAVSPEFGKLPNLAPQEHQQLVEEVRQFHDTANAVPFDPNHDLPLLMREQGLERTLQRVEVKPAKEMSLQMRRYETANRAGEGALKGVQWQLRTPNVQLRLHERNISPAFGRLRDLTRIEQMLFHNEQGIHRFDWDAAITTKQFGLAFSQMRVREIGAGLYRMSARLIHPLVELHYHQRQVDPDFARAHDLADPERDFFAQLRGYNQHDWTAKLRPTQNLQLELFGFGARNPLEAIDNRRQRYRFVWQPFKNLTLGRQQDEYESDKIIERLYQDEYERNDLQYHLGWGQLNAYQERRRIGGTLANPLYQDTEFWRFNTAAIRNLNLALEERRTNATGMPSERYRHYQTAYTLNPRTKLQFAHMEANRDGAPDESAQQVGLEYEIAQGAKLTFSETRNAKEGANGTRVLSAGLTQTAFGVLSIGGAYQEQRIDRTNTRAQSQVVIQSAKPFHFLGLQELQFDFRYGALADRGAWQQENKHFTAQAIALRHKLAGGYVGLYVPGQGRAVDRYYQLESPPHPQLTYRLHYKTRTYQDGRLFLVRHYNIAYKLDGRLTLTHEFQTHPEQANAQVVLGSVLQPTGFSAWGMEWRWTPRILLRGDYRIEWNDQQNRRTRRGGLTLSANQSDNLQYSVGYRVDAERFGERNGIAHTFFLSTERKLDSENFLMFGFQWTHYERRPDPSIPRDQQRLVLEWRRPF
ncbi:MAG: hypothetical protein KatS3mg019_2577 [Fimbriimonadales bacterium]|nr:MAG: hypothetical protein KatS3mg019_2577 [Fimbriimonadales bacterium]